MMMATQKKEPVAVTAVFWDIKKCPIPPGFDARRVGPCIKRFVEKLGYSGPLTIFAIGRLTDVPVEVLRALSSTGIVPNIAPFGTSNLMSLVFRWVGRNPPPANIMIISDPRRKFFCRNFDMLQHCMGYNILKPYPYGLPQAGYYTSAKYLWKSFLLAESGALEEDKCIETGAYWVCSVCRGLPSGQGLENFTRHLYSEKHAREKLDWLPSKYECDKDEEEEEEELLLEAVEAGVKLQPERWEKFSYLFATPRECPPLAGVEAPLDSHPENATTMGMEDDPFLRPFQPSDLKTASEFLKNWLPFLSKDLCKDCVHVLSNRIRSLDPASPRMSWEDEVKDDEEEEEQRNLSKRAFDATLIVTPEKPKLSRENVRLMSVERKKDFIFYERVKGKRVNLLDGLELHTGVISVPEQIRIVNEVYELQEKGRRGELKERTFTDPQKWMNGKGRVTLNFGCCYNYTMDKAGNPPGILQREEVDPLPDVFKLIIKRLIKWHILPPTCVPDSCIVNIYEEGACIPPHIDNHDFLRPFCTISFLSECNILFGSKLKVVGPGEFSGSFSIPLPVGSVLVLNGNGADVAEHCVPAVPTKRISITFRKMDESKRPVLFTTERDLQGIKPLSLELADKCMNAHIRTKESKAKTGEKKST